MSDRLKFKGDYMGFTYNGKHSSEFGIVRISDGSRFNENLLPTIQDKTVQVPGGDGTYYFGSYYTQKPFSISFAFDDLTEEDLAAFQAHFGDKQIHDLIFDERPYKIYSAKVTGTASIKYIPFAQGETNRLYKGEGSIQFTCYYPFARCAFEDTVSKESLRDRYPNVDEWWGAARIEPNKNFGDLEASFMLDITNSGSITTNNGSISWNLGATWATLNTKSGLAITANGDIVNDKLSGNLTMKIPVGAVKTNSTGNNIISIVNGENLRYDRLYI